MNTVTGTRLNTQLRTFLLLAGLTGLLVAIGGILFKGPIPIELDLVALGAGRNELNLNLSALGPKWILLRIEARRLARVLARRMQS